LNCKDKDLPNGRVKLLLSTNLLWTPALFPRELRPQLRKQDFRVNAPDSRKRSILKPLMPTSKAPRLKKLRRKKPKKKPRTPPMPKARVKRRRPRSTPPLRPRKLRSRKKPPRLKSKFSLRRSMLLKRRLKFSNSKRRLKTKSPLLLRRRDKPY